MNGTNGLIETNARFKRHRELIGIAEFGYMGQSRL